MWLLDRGRQVYEASIRVPLGEDRARSHCRFALPPIHFIPDSLTYSVLFPLKRRDRTLGKDWNSAKTFREKTKPAGLDEGFLQLYCPHSCIYGESQ